MTKKHETCHKLRLASMRHVISQKGRPTYIPRQLWRTKNSMWNIIRFGKIGTTFECLHYMFMLCTISSCMLEKKTPFFFYWSNLSHFPCLLQILIWSILLHAAVWDLLFRILVGFDQQLLSLKQLYILTSLRQHGFHPSTHPWLIKKKKAVQCRISHLQRFGCYFQHIRYLIMG